MCKACLLVVQNTHMLQSRCGQASGGGTRVSSTGVPVKGGPVGAKCLRRCKSCCVCRLELEDPGWLNLDKRRHRKFEAGQGHIQVWLTLSLPP